MRRVGHDWSRFSRTPRALRFHPSCCALSARFGGHPERVHELRVPPARRARRPRGLQPTDFRARRGTKAPGLRSGRIAVSVLPTGGLPLSAAADGEPPRLKPKIRRTPAHTLLVQDPTSWGPSAVVRATSLSSLSRVRARTSRSPMRAVLNPVGAATAGRSSTFNPTGS